MESQCLNVIYPCTLPICINECLWLDPNKAAEVWNCSHLVYRSFINSFIFRKRKGTQKSLYKSLSARSAPTACCTLKTSFVTYAYCCCCVVVCRVPVCCLPQQTPLTASALPPHGDAKGKRRVSRFRCLLKVPTSSNLIQTLHYPTPHNQSVTLAF